MKTFYIGLIIVTVVTIVLRFFYPVDSDIFIVTLVMCWGVFIWMEAFVYFCTRHPNSTVKIVLSLLLSVIMLLTSVSFLAMEIFVDGLSDLHWQTQQNFKLLGRAIGFSAVFGFIMSLLLRIFHPLKEEQQIRILNHIKSKM